MTELKPCPNPKCHSKDVRIIEDYDYRIPNKVYYWITCFNCGYQSEETYDTKKQAIDAWNKRS